MLKFKIDYDSMYDMLTVSQVEIEDLPHIIHRFHIGYVYTMADARSLIVSRGATHENTYISLDAIKYVEEEGTGL